MGISCTTWFAPPCMEHKLKPRLVSKMPQGPWKISCIGILQKKINLRLKIKSSSLQPSFPCMQRARADMEGLLGHGNPDVAEREFGFKAWMWFFHDPSTLQGHRDGISLIYHLNIATRWTGSLINVMRWQSAEVVPPPRLASTFWPPWQGPNGTWNFGILGSDEDVDSYRIKQGGREYAWIQWRYGVSVAVI